MRNPMLALVVAPCLLLPAQSQIFKPSMNDQVKLGQQASQELRQEEQVVSAGDARVLKIREIAARLLATVPQKERESKPWKWSFDLILSDTVNAFNLPGGPTFVYAGLYDQFETEDQLAAVLAHEITHTRKEHWAKDYGNTQQNRFGIAILGTLLGASNDVMTAASIIEVVGVGLPRSRKYETEADTVGFDMMVAAGYNPQGMVEVFQKLMAQGGSVPEFISDHPDDKRRIKNISERIAKAGRTYPAEKPLTVKSPLNEVRPQKKLLKPNPFQVAPGEKAGTIEVRWRGADGKNVAYDLEWYTDKQLKQKAGSARVNETYVLLQNMESGRNYTFRVRSVRGKETGPWSDPVTARAR